MEYLIAIGYLIGWVVTVICCRFISTTVHELGHAIPSLMYTDGEVKIHVGSYGDERSKKIQIGRFTAFFKFNPLRLNMGLCQSEGQRTIAQNIRIVLGGPLASLLLGVVLLLPLWLIPMPQELVTVLMALILSGVWDFFVNIIPMQQSVRLYNGSYIFNDGQQLLHYMKLRTYPLEFHKATAYFEAGDYQSAIVNFRKTIESGADDKPGYYFLIQALLKQGNNKSALLCCEEVDQKFKLKPADFELFAYVFMQNSNYTKAIECLDQSIYYNFSNPLAYNNRGYAFLMLEEYDRAAADFRMAIRNDPKFAFPYNNLALVYLRKGETDKVIPLIEKSRELNPDNPFLALHMGYYHEAMGNHKEALNHFEQAREQHIELARIDDLIENTKEKATLKV